MFFQSKADLVIAADTVVVLGDKILEKPPSQLYGVFLFYRLFWQIRLKLKKC